MTFCKVKPSKTECKKCKKIARSEKKKTGCKLCPGFRSEVELKMIYNRKGRAYATVIEDRKTREVKASEIYDIREVRSDGKM